MPLKSELEENPFAFPIEEDDLKSARQYRERFDSEEEFQEALAIWPRCPVCGRRRITRCPVCKTSADLFPLGDDEFFDPTARATAEETSARPVCSCGNCRERRALFNEAERPSLLGGELIPGAPDPRRQITLDLSDVFDDAPEERETREAWFAASEDGGREEPPTLVCHVCSEAFRPVFPRRCEWCDYDFREGETYPEPSDETNREIEDFLKRKEEQDEREAFEPDSKRITIVWIALGAAILAFLLYWTFIF